MSARERSHPLFTGLAEQREAWTQAIQTLPDRHFFLRQANGSVSELTAPEIVDPAWLGRIAGEHLSTHFWPQAVIEKMLRDQRPETSAPTTTRRKVIGPKR